MSKKPAKSKTVSASAKVDRLIETDFDGTVDRVVEDDGKIKHRSESVRLLCRSIVDQGDWGMDNLWKDFIRRLEADPERNKLLSEIVACWFSERYQEMEDKSFSDFLR